MGFWIFMLLTALLSPLTMICFGARFVSKPPDRINAVYGYRTRRSMKNADTWRFAHSHFGRLWKHIGWVLLPLSVIAMLLVRGRGEAAVGRTGTILMLVQMIVLLVPVFATERALKEQFDENGRKREVLP